MEEYNRADELRHYGRKGMKWYQSIYGKVRARKTAKKRAESLKKARETKAANKAAAEERARLISKDKMSPKKMTNAELEQRIARLQLEKNYKDAVKNSRSFEKGKRFIDKFSDSTIDKVADSVAADLIAQTVKVFGEKAINKGLNKALGTDSEGYVFTNNKRK